MRRSKPVKKFNLNMKKSLIFVMFVAIVIFVTLIFRIFYIIENDSDRYKKKVLSQQTYVSSNILYKRGEIRDRNGTVLAVSIKVYDLVISPKDIIGESDGSTDNEQAAADREFTIQTLVNCFGLDRDELEKTINDNPTSQYRIISSKKGMTQDEIQPFLDAQESAKENAKENKETPQIKGVWFEERYARKYPLGHIACNVVGFTDKNGEIGNTGIEATYNDELTGSYGREYGYFDAELNLQRTIMPAVDGNNIVSTIDANVQRIVENQIAKLMSDLGAKNAAIVIMNPQNGEILAMASNTNYDLNDPWNLTSLYSESEIKNMSEEEQSNALNALWSNFCISHTYEPGSTFKPFVVAAALDEGTTNPNIVYTCNGKMQVSDYEIGCANRIVHGAVTPKIALMESCNVALMQIAAGLGRTQFYRYMNLYGFGSKTGIDLDREERGIIHSEDSLNTVELATSSFGQTQNVTMVQMISAFCSLINGGYYYEPHVVKEIINEQNAVVKKSEGEIVKQTITNHTSSLIREYLKATVESGTAVPAQVKGYDIGGKTGTAEKHGENQEDNYIVSFMGFAPTDDPQVAIYVLIDQPAVEDQSHSTYATEFASKVMKKVLPFLNVYPDASADTKADSTKEPEADSTKEPEADSTAEPETEPAKEPTAEPAE